MAGVTYSVHVQHRFDIYTIAYNIIRTGSSIAAPNPMVGQHPM